MAIGPEPDPVYTVGNGYAHHIAAVDVDAIQVSFNRRLFETGKPKLLLIVTDKCDCAVHTGRTTGRTQCPIPLRYLIEQFPICIELVKV